jgi:pentatricopeptide repeat protein
MQVDRALEVYKMVQEYGIKGTADVYTMAVNACSQKGDLDSALGVYNDMMRNGVRPDEVSCSTLSFRVFFKWYLFKFMQFFQYRVVLMFMKCLIIELGE